MAMVNMNNLLNGKDSRWLQLEVCREFQRNKCTRSDTECKFAHPPANVEVQNGRVTACYDSIKGRCNREKPPCKYFHPPQHLKDQLLINGRNHLALKNALLQQMGLTPPGQALIPGQVPAVVDGQMEYATPLMLGQHIMATNPYLAGMPQVGSTFSPYFTPGPVMPAILGPDPSSVASPLSVVPQTVVAQQKMPRSDRLEPVSVATVGAVELGKKRPRDPSDDILLMDMKSVGSFYYDSFAFPGMVPYKRPAADKSGMPVYQPSATTYQQLMQPFVPVSCEYSTPVATVTSSSASPATPGGSAPGDEPPSEVDKLPPASSEQAKVGVNPVVALNYTGITLNKQTMAVPPPSQPRYPTPMPTMPVAMSVASPYHPHTAGLLAYSRAGNPAFVSPYSFMRPQFMQSPFTMMPQAQGPFMHNGLLANVMSPYTSMTTPVMTPAHTPTSNNNNNNNSIMSASVALQPYKKMKTT